MNDSVASTLGRNKAWSLLLYAFFWLGILLLSGCTSDPLMTDTVRKAPVETRKTALSKDTAHLMTPDDYVRLTNIQTHVLKTQQITEEDIVFCKGLLTKGPLVKDAKNLSELRRVVLLRLGGKKQLTPAQQQALYALAQPILSDPDSATQVAAAFVITTTGDSRAVGDLTHLFQSSKDASLKRNVQKYLDTLRPAEKTKTL